VLRLVFVLNARLAHQRVRALLSMIGIALGVALGFGVHLINRAAVSDLASAVRRVAGEADLQVSGGQQGFPDRLYARIARLPGVAAASPVLDLRAGLAGRRGTLRVIGLDPLRAARLQPRLFASDRRGMLGLLQPDTVLLSAAAAGALRLRQGDRLALVAGLRRVELEIIGVLPSGALKGPAALADIATAQWRLGRLDTLSRVDLRLAQGADRETMQRRIAALLPPGTYVTRVESAEQESAAPSRAYRVNLNVLAMVALFTGGFLVFSAQALEVARRRSEHALLRVLGLEGRGVARLVLIEAGAVGVLGSALGLALGYVLARFALHYAGADLGAGMFRGIEPQITVPAWMAAAYFAAGVALALAGAWLPARDAAAAAPAQALKAGDEQRMFERIVSLWPGLALLAAGGALALPGPLAGIPVFGYASIACLLLGGVLLMPRVSRALFDALPLPRRVPMALALAQLRGSPGQATVSLAAIVASFSLMVAMAIMVSSFRHSFGEWLDTVLPADLYFRTPLANDTAYLDASFERAVRGLPQVRRAAFMRILRITLDPARPPVALLARDLPDGPRQAYPMVGRPYALKPGDPPPVWVSEAMVDLYGDVPGRRIELPLGGKLHEFVVAGVYRDYARQHGAILMERPLYVALTGDRGATDGALWLAPGASVATAERAIRALPGGDLLDVSDASGIRAASLRIFDRSFAVTYGLEAVAVLVGLFGLSSSLGAIVLARRREFGMLRHLGMTRAQIGAMLASEGALLAALGALAGLALGGVISLVLVYVVDRQSFNWSMDLHAPLVFLGALGAVLIALASLTAFLSGREAMSMGAVRAVKEDW